MHHIYTKYMECFWYSRWKGACAFGWQWTKRFPCLGRFPLQDITTLSQERQWKWDRFMWTVRLSIRCRRAVWISHWCEVHWRWGLYGLKKWFWKTQTSKPIWITFDMRFIKRLLWNIHPAWLNLLLLKRRFYVLCWSLCTQIWMQQLHQDHTGSSY